MFICAPKSAMQFSLFTRFSVNYGGSVLQWMDRLHGTDAAYRGTDQSKRDHRFFSFTKTIRDIHPDTPKWNTNGKMD